MQCLGRDDDAFGPCSASPGTQGSNIEVNALEATTVKAWQRYVRALGALFSFVAATEAGAQAITQTLRPGQTAGPRFLVPVFRSTDKALGVQTADEIRNRLIGDYMAKDLLIVPKSD